MLYRGQLTILVSVYILLYWRTHLLTIRTVPFLPCKRGRFDSSTSEEIPIITSITANHWLITLQGIADRTEPTPSPEGEDWGGAGVGSTAGTSVPTWSSLSDDRDSSRENKYFKERTCTVPHPCLTVADLIPPATFVRHFLGRSHLGGPHMCYQTPAQNTSVKF